MSGTASPQAGTRPRQIRLPEICDRLEARWLSAAFVLALALRLVFSLTVSKVQLTWDAAAYWSETQQIRASVCSTLLYCEPGTGPQAGLSDVIDTVAFSKYGLLPLLHGLGLSVLPNTVTTALVGFAIIDALGCVMIAVIVRRLGGPLWAAALTAILMAVYVPGIVGDGSFLQQPLIRFGVVAAALSYTCAFTTVRHQKGFITAGMSSVLVVAFASQSTRPLLWIVPAAVIAIAASQSSSRELAWMQLRASAVVGTALLAAAVLIAMTSAHTFADALTNLGLGLSTAGTASGQATVRSFEHFWPTDAWTYFADANTTRSLLSDFAAAPGEFIKLWSYSAYANWRYPDLLYFQEFGLGRRGQQLQHLLLVIPGFAGLAWLIGQAGVRRRVGLISLVLIVTVSAIAAVVSVEPRRVGALMPLLALGAGCFVWSLAARRTWGRFELAGVAALALCATAWALSVPDVMAIAPLSPTAGHAVLVAVRVVTATIVGAWLLLEWRRSDKGFSIAIPAALLSGLLIVVVASGLPGEEWRPWAATISAPIRQQIDGIRVNPERRQWLIADFGTPRDAAATAIYVNGRLVKRAGAPMRRWQADGAMLGWTPYLALEQMSANQAEPQTWVALSLPDGAIRNSRLTVEVHPPRSGVILAGDYAHADSTRYTGPALDPFFTGFSLWRWIWNGSDPRIPLTQDLGARYVSSRLDGATWRSDDLSAGFGRPTGHFRIFVSQQPFGERTNILDRAPAPVIVLPPTPAPPSRCGAGRLYATTADSTPGNPYLCAEPGGKLAYYSAASVRLGASAPNVFSATALRGAVVDTARSRAGTVEVTSAGGPLFLASIYDSEHRLVYSLGFRYPAVLPTYL